MPSAKKGVGIREVRVGLMVVLVIDGKPADDLIRDDSKALLGSPSLLGSDKVINVTPGTQLGQKVKDGQLLQQGTEAGTVSALTESGNELMQQLNKLSAQFTDIATKVNQGQGTLGPG